MRPRFLFLFVLLTTSVLHASGWHTFSDPRRSGPAAYDQAAPVVASNGFDYLVAWTTVTFSPARTYAVYAAQVLSDSTVNVALPVALDDDSQFAHGVSLTPGRDGYFAAWMSENGLRASILDSFGRVERTATVPQNDPYQSARTIAAWDGATYLVVSGFATAFTATLFDNNCAVVASQLPIGDTHSDPTSVAVVADSAGFLVLSTKRNYAGAVIDAIYGRRIAPNGTIGEWFLIRPVASAVSGVAIVKNGSRDTLAWSDQFGIWSMDFDPQTNTAGPSRQLSPATDATVTRAVLANGTTWIGYQTSPGQKNYALPVAADGSPGLPVEIGDGFRVELATSGTKVLAVRSAQIAGPAYADDVAGRFVVPSVSSDFAISRSETDQENGSLASDGSNVLTVWDEQVGADRLVYAARFDATGAALDGAGVQISSGGTNWLPRAAFNGHDWLVVWRHSDEASSSTLVGRRFSTSGRLVDTGDIVFGPASYGAAGLTSDGINWLVAWLSPRSGMGCNYFGSPTRAVASRVSPAGIVLDPGGRVLEPESRADQVNVDVAFDGTNYVYAWTEQCSGYHQPTTSAITAALTPSDVSRVQAFSVAAAATTPRIVASSGHFLVAWPTGLGTTSYRLIATSSIPQRIGRARAVGTPASITNVDGVLIGTVAEPNGLFTIVTEKPTEWVANAPQGLFTKTINADNVQVATGFAGLVGNGPARFPGAEVFSGNIVLHGRNRWIADSWFDLRGGAQRFWIRDLD